MKDVREDRETARWGTNAAMPGSSDAANLSIAREEEGWPSSSAT
jgi:hypothetical protein